MFAMVCLHPRNMRKNQSLEKLKMHAVAWGRSGSSLPKNQTLEKLKRSVLARCCLWLALRR
jgi:hypothetical protein